MSQGPSHYRWPWVLLAVVILGVTVAVAAMIREARRVRSQRDSGGLPAGYALPPASNAPAAAPPAQPAR